MDHSKLRKILKEMGIPDYLTCLLRNLSGRSGQEATVRTGHGTMDQFRTGKGVRQGCILHSAYLTFMKSTSCEIPGWMKLELESVLPGEISVFRRNINNLRYADDTTLMAEGLKNLLMKVKEESEKAGLKLTIQKTKVMASSPVTSWQIDG